MKTNSLRIASQVFFTIGVLILIFTYFQTTAARNAAGSVMMDKLPRNKEPFTQDEILAAYSYATESHNARVFVFASISSVAVSAFFSFGANYREKRNVMKSEWPTITAQVFWVVGILLLLYIIPVMSASNKAGVVAMIVELPSAKEPFSQDEILAAYLDATKAHTTRNLVVAALCFFAGSAVFQCVGKNQKERTP